MNHVAHQWISLMCDMTQESWAPSNRNSKKSEWYSNERILRLFRKPFVLVPGVPGFSWDLWLVPCHHLVLRNLEHPRIEILKSQNEILIRENLEILSKNFRLVPGVPGFSWDLWSVPCHHLVLRNLEHPRIEIVKVRMEFSWENLEHLKIEILTRIHIHTWIYYSSALTLENFLSRVHIV